MTRILASVISMLLISNGALLVSRAGPGHVPAIDGMANGPGQDPSGTFGPDPRPEATSEELPPEWQNIPPERTIDLLVRPGRAGLLTRVTVEVTDTYRSDGWPELTVDWGDGKTWAASRSDFSRSTTETSWGTEDTWTVELDHRYLQSGTYLFMARCPDCAARGDHINVRPVVEVPTELPTALPDLEPEPRVAEIDPPREIHVDASVELTVKVFDNDDHQDRPAGAIDWGDGSATSLDWNSAWGRDIGHNNWYSLDLTHTWTAVGDYRVTFQCETCESVTITVEVLPAPPPGRPMYLWGHNNSAELGSPSSFRLGVDDSKSEFAGEVPSGAVIDWGDGTTTVVDEVATWHADATMSWTTSPISHTWHEPGRYIVRYSCDETCAPGWTFIDVTDTSTEP